MSRVHSSKIPHRFAHLWMYLAREERRRRAKLFPLGLPKLSPEETRRLRDQFFGNFPEMQTWQRKVLNDLASRGLSPTGRALSSFDETHDLRRQSAKHVDFGKALLSLEHQRDLRDIRIDKYGAGPVADHFVTVRKAPRTPANVSMTKVTMVDREALSSSSEVAGGASGPTSIDSLPECVEPGPCFEHPECRGALKCAGEHRDHGRGEDGPDDHDCPCRGTEKEKECSESGCGFCGFRRSAKSDERGALLHPDIASTLRQAAAENKALRGPEFIVLVVDSPAGRLEGMRRALGSERFAQLVVEKGAPRIVLGDELGARGNVLEPLLVGLTAGTPKRASPPFPTGKQRKGKGRGGMRGKGRRGGGR